MEGKCLSPSSLIPSESFRSILRISGFLPDNECVDFPSCSKGIPFRSTAYDPFLWSVTRRASARLSSVSSDPASSSPVLYSLLLLLSVDAALERIRPGRRNAFGTASSPTAESLSPLFFHFPLFGKIIYWVKLLGRLLPPNAVVSQTRFVGILPLNPPSLYGFFVTPILLKIPERRCFNVYGFGGALNLTSSIYFFRLRLRRFNGTSARAAFPPPPFPSGRPIPQNIKSPSTRFPQSWPPSRKDSPRRLLFPLPCPKAD